MRNLRKTRVNMYLGTPQKHKVQPDETTHVLSVKTMSPNKERHSDELV